MLDRDARSFSGPPYAYDLFVSYSHGDPRGLGESPLATWTHRFIDHLEQDIHSTSDEFDLFRLWDDRKFDPTLKLTETTKQYVSQSALLLVVMSPRYLSSSWCKDELAWFEEELRRRGQEEGCTLVVRALPTEEKRWPAPLKDGDGKSVIGFWFHKRPPTEGVRAFGWPDPQTSDRAFFDVLSALSSTVQQRLRKIRQRHALQERLAEAESSPAVERTAAVNGTRHEAEEPPETVQEKPVVYLHARQNDVEQWRAVREQLIDHGFGVLPATPIEGTPDLSGLRLLRELRRRRVTSYLDSDALLILRPQAGPWINDELKTVGFDELRELDAFYQKRVPCAVLDFVNDDAMLCGELNIKRFVGQADWLPQFSRWLSSCRPANTAIGEESAAGSSS